MKPSMKRTAGYIAFLYAAVGCAWILLSDLAVESIVRDPAIIIRLQIYKGFAFVLLTAAMLYVILRRRLVAVENAQKHLEQFKFIVEHAGQEIYLVDKNGNIVYANHAAAKSLGYTADEMVRMSLSDFDQVYGPPFEAHFEKLKKDGVISPFETTHMAMDGTLIPKEMRSVFLHMGKEDLICGFGFDITRRKQNEEALIAEKELLAVTLASIGDGVITTDVAGNVTTINQVAESLTGWTQEDARGRKITEVFDIIDGASGKRCPNPVETVTASGQTQTLCENIILISKEKKKFLIADSGAPITDRNNQLIGVVLVFRDITEKQKLIEAAQNTDKLESLGLLAGGIAHDFNNLLGGVFGYIELGKLKNTDPEAAKLLDKALDAIEKARSLTRQLLTFAQGGDPIKKQQLLYPFIQETTTFLLSGTNISYRFDVAEDLWPCYFDENQIRQVIENIITNACQAMVNGGILEISAKNKVMGKSAAASATDHYVEISIKDDGMGIPRNILPHIFDPYFTTKAKAHGIGLTTCFSIIKRHNGFMDVTSESGKGSTFHIYLPAADLPGEKTAVQADKHLV